MIPDDLRAARQILIDAGMSDGEADDLVSLAEREIAHYLGTWADAVLRACDVHGGE
jgi:hypothetical protein